MTGERPGGLRLASYNVEWFNALFDDHGRLLEDRELSARYQTTRAEQLAALGIVFAALDADGIVIIEAPDTSARRSTVVALENFARAVGLRARKAMIGFASETEQEIAFLFDPDRLSARHDPQGEPSGRKGLAGAPRFDTTFRYDLDADGQFDTIRFSKPPLELALTLPGGRALRLIGVHAKSKAPHGVSGRDEMMRVSIENRRKQLAQCIWLRGRVDQHLQAGEDVLVMGDFNDGPGLDRFERLFGRSGIEIVMAPEAEPALQMQEPHAELALRRKVGLAPTTARFWYAPNKCYFEALLDFIMVSPGLAALPPVWRIWHPLNDPALARVPELQQALLTASDHFPVSIDLPL